MTAEGLGEEQVSREQLYDLVWSEPMQALGPRFGLSDVGLKKICKKLRVPTPGRGYWAKKAVGAAPRPTPLPKLPASVRAEQQVVTLGRPPRARPKNADEDTGPVADQKRYETLPEHWITVADTLTDPHRLVASSVHLLRQAKSDDQHRLIPRGKRCVAAAVTVGTADRAMLVYDALFKACETRGWAVELKEVEKASVTTLIVREEPIGIVLEERIERVERKPDPKVSRSYYLKEYDYTPTGRLTVRLQVSYLGVRQTWSDGAKQRVEDCLNDVMVGLVAASEALKVQRLEREAREREYQRQEERRQLAERRRQEEATRIRALDSELTAWRKSRVVREYASEMRQAAATAGLLGDETPMTRWLAWVDSYADRVDPTREPRVPEDPDPYGYRAYGSGRDNTDARSDW